MLNSFNPDQDRCTFVGPDLGLNFTKVFSRQQKMPQSRKEFNGSLHNVVLSFVSTGKNLVDLDKLILFDMMMFMLNNIFLTTCNGVH